ncbi:MAG: hypothetical protein WCE62_18830, partial [Polyangiales bacterium]
MRSTKYESASTPGDSASAERQESSFWPLLFATPVFLLVAAYHLGPVRFHSDDHPWIDAARGGLVSGLVSSDPYGHFRPVFHAWIWALDTLGVSSPAGFGFVGLGLQLVLIALTFAVFRAFVGSQGASVGAALVAIHPVRQDHWFWVCTQIDLLCLIFIMAALWLGVRFVRSPGSAVLLVALAAVTFAGALTKESALAIPFAVFLLPSSNANIRSRALAAGAAGLGALAAILATTAVLHGIGGHTRAMLQAPDYLRLLRFWLRMIVPFDWRALWYQFQTRQSLTPLWPVLALGISGLAAAAYGIAAWKTRRLATTWLSLVLAVWAAAIWSLHEPDRSLGIAAFSLAALLAGILQATPARTTVLVMVAFSALWAPRWWHCVTVWRATDEEGEHLEASLAEWRGRVRRDEQVVALGTPYEIADIGQPERIFELDHCASRVLEIDQAATDFAAAIYTPAPAGMIRVANNRQASFGSCQTKLEIQGAVEGVLSDHAIPARTCNEIGMLTSVVVDP